MQQSEMMGRWRGPQWTLAILMALITSIGPFAIDAYLPAFEGIRQSLSASPTQMQQTLSIYLLSFAVMNLFHGALADSFGRRPVLLWGTALLLISSAGCAMAQTIGQLITMRAIQGACAGAGAVVSRAVVRDLFSPEQAQKVMSQISIFFGLAPAIAPMIGGWMFVQWGWSSIFWMLAGLCALIWICTYRFLPESLHSVDRQAFNAPNLLHGYMQLCTSGRFLLLITAAYVPFNGVFLYVLSSPSFLGELLHLPPTRFFWFFVCMIAGMTTGAWLSGRLAGKVWPVRQAGWGFVVMAVVAIINLWANLCVPLHPFWALPILGFYAVGWALMVPVVTLMSLDIYPRRRGMASSFQTFFAASVNAAVAGFLSPLVMHSGVGLACVSFSLLVIGLTAWMLVRRQMTQSCATQ